MPTFTISKASEPSADHEADFTVTSSDQAAQWPQALRHALLTKCEGIAATAVGVVTSAGRARHEFSELTGVDASVPDLMLSLGNVRFALPPTQTEQLITLNAVGPRVVTSTDLTQAGVEVLTPGVVLFTVGSGASATFEVLLQRGRGYSLVSERPPGSTPEGLIAMNAMFSPVLNVSVFVAATHELQVRVKTDGSIAPRRALEQAIVDW